MPSSLCRFFSFAAAMAIILLQTAGGTPTASTSGRTPQLHTIAADISPQEIKRRSVAAYVPAPALIAHRGTTYWAPESTEAAWRWARNMGADYLEADLQLSRDGIIVLVHDDDFSQKTDIAAVFPGRRRQRPITFTYQEMLQLDAGSWFNKKNPERARAGFQSLEILTLADLIKIAEGYQLARDKYGKRSRDAAGHYLFSKDPQDNGNRPGIYIEIKNPEQNPGIEEKLQAELRRLHWDITQTPATATAFYQHGKVNVGKTAGKVVLQSFAPASIITLNNIFQGELPLVFLWEWYENPLNAARPGKHFLANLDFAVTHNVHFIGPAIRGVFTRRGRAAYKNTLHRRALGLHPYSFNSRREILAWSAYADGMLTNRLDLNIKYAGHKITAGKTAGEILSVLGYDRPVAPPPANTD